MSHDKVESLRGPLGRGGPDQRNDQTLTEFTKLFGPNWWIDDFRKGSTQDFGSKDCVWTFKSVSKSC